MSDFFRDLVEELREIEGGNSIDYSLIFKGEEEFINLIAMKINKNELLDKVEYRVVAEMIKAIEHKKNHTKRVGLTKKEEYILFLEKEIVRSVSWYDLKVVNFMNVAALMAMIEEILESELQVFGMIAEYISSGDYDVYKNKHSELISDINQAEKIRYEQDESKANVKEKRVGLTEIEVTKNMSSNIKSEPVSHSHVKEITMKTTEEADDKLRDAYDEEISVNFILESAKKGDYNPAMKLIRRFTKDFTQELDIDLLTLELFKNGEGTTFGAITEVKGIMLYLLIMETFKR